VAAVVEPDVQMLEVSRPELIPLFNGLSVLQFGKIVTVVRRRAAADWPRYPAGVLTRGRCAGPEAPAVPPPRDCAVSWNADQYRMRDACFMLRCLIVDDNTRFLDAARGLLEREGVAVVGVASTGAEAAERVGQLRPDVVLLDIDLGGQSGFDVATQLHGDAQLAPRIILISTHAEQDYVDLIAASPAVGFLSKTVLSASAIRGLLNGDGGADPVARRWSAVGGGGRRAGSAWRPSRSRTSWSARMTCNPVVRRHHRCAPAGPRGSAPSSCPAFSASLLL
jgi:CheY-like chemotaxis protein